MIYINSHEPKDIADYLRGKTEITVKNFTPADYIIGDIGIERKTINDFLSSLVQKRLFEQLSRLKDCYGNSMLLIEAFDLSHFSNTNVIYGAILKIMIDMNIKIIFSQTKKQSADILLILNNKNGKNIYNQKLLAYQLKYKKKECTITQKQLQMLSSIPNVGTKRAKLLLSRFKTIKEIFEAEDEKLLSVEGIGRKTISNIRSIFKRHNNYTQ